MFQPRYSILGRFDMADDEGEEMAAALVARVAAMPPDALRMAEALREGLRAIAAAGHGEVWASRGYIIAEAERATGRTLRNLL